MAPQLDPATDARTRTSVQDVVALPSFDAAAEAVLTCLSSTFALALWMVTRTAGDDWVVLRATDSPYGVGAGDVLRWSDSLCARMVRGEGPRVSPRIADVPAYREARLLASTRSAATSASR